MVFALRLSSCFSGQNFLIIGVAGCCFDSHYSNVSFPKLCHDVKSKLSYQGAAFDFVLMSFVTLGDRF